MLSHFLFYRRQPDARHRALQRILYLYLSDGTKLAALKDGSGLIYCGSMVFSCSFSGTAPAVDFESTGFSAGRIVKKDGAVQPEYHVNDYLCSVRVVTDAHGEVLERNDYSGYGKRLVSSLTSPAAEIANRYRFGGKEEQGFAGVPWQDFGARMYDPDLARWTTPDPLAEKYPGISPYVYCNSNPVNFVDPDGMAWGKVGKVAKKVYKTVKAGNKVSVKGILKSEWLDIVDNAHTIIDSDASLFEKGVAVFDLATGFGDEVKWFAKTVGVSDAIVDGARVIDGIKFKSFTERNFRDNLMRLTGETPDASKHAHHIFPKGVKNFSKTEINPNDPHFGIWLDADVHLGEGRAIEYNKAWEKFFEVNQRPTTDQLFDQARKLMKEICGTEVF